MPIQSHLSSDISANLLVASIAEGLTNTIKSINIDRTDRNKILSNLLEINKIVEQSKSNEKFSTFKLQLEDIQEILNEPIHKCWMDKILSKTEDLISFMKCSHHTLKNNHRVEVIQSDDIIRQCFQEWNELIAKSSEHLKRENQIEYIDPQDSKVRIIHMAPQWDKSHSFVSESEVLIVNYSRIKHEKSKESVSEPMKANTGKTPEDKLCGNSNDQPSEGGTNKRKIQEALKVLNQELRQVLLDSLGRTKILYASDKTVKLHDSNETMKSQKRQENGEKVEISSRQHTEENNTSEENGCILDMVQRRSNEDESKKKTEKVVCNLPHVSKNKNETIEATAQENPAAVYMAKISEAKKFNTRKKLSRLGTYSSTDKQSMCFSELKSSPPINSKVHKSSRASRNPSSPERQEPSGSMFQYLGQLCYEKLFAGTDESSLKIESILTACDDKKLPKHTEKMARSRGDRKSRKHDKSNKKKHVDAMGVEDLKSCCVSIRKELDSIESKAAKLKLKSRERSWPVHEQNLESGDKDQSSEEEMEHHNQCHQINSITSAMGYCNIM